MLSWTVAHAQTEPTTRHPADEAVPGLVPTAPAAWAAATDAALAMLGAFPDDTRPVVLRVEVADGHDADHTQATDAACSMIVVSPERDADGAPKSSATRAAIEDHVAAILGAAALTDAARQRATS